MIEEKEQSTGKGDHGNFLFRNRGYLIIGTIFVLSCGYLFFIVSVLVSATNPDCVANKQILNLGLFGTNRVPIACKDLSLNEVGDYFAGLVSLLATVWLIVAFVWQAMELAFQRREFRASNSIAQSRAASEDIWRKLEFHKMLREKLGRTVNEASALKAKIENTAAPQNTVVISDLIRLAREEPDQYDSSSYEAANILKIERLNTLIRTSKGIVEALDRLETDEELKGFLDLFN